IFEFVDLRVDLAPLSPEQLDQSPQLAGKMRLVLIKDVRQRPCKTCRPNSDEDASVLQERSNLIDDARPPTDKAASNSVHRLKVELVGSFDRYEAHVRPTDSLRNRFRVQVVVLVALQIGTNELR